MNQASKLKIGVVTYPISGSGAGSIILSSFISILEPLADKIVIISEDFHSENQFQSEKSEIYNVHGYPTDKKTSSLFNIVLYVKYQILLSLKIIQCSDKIDLVFMYGGSSLLIPNICAHLMGYKVAIFAQGPDYNVVPLSYPSTIGKLLYHIVKIVGLLNLSLADRIIVQSEKMVDYENLTQFTHKILPLGARYVDNSLLNYEIPYDHRDSIVGFVGRFEKEKGILEFVDSIPIVHSINPRIKFIIGGDGSLKDEVNRKLHESGLTAHVELLGWVPQKDLPHILSNMRLLVMPSSSEGLPTIALESMACGTPVLATPVGGVPDIITDGETGYIIDVNTPNSIAKKILEILDQPDGNVISCNGKKIILAKYTFNKAVIRYRQIIESLEE